MQQTETSSAVVAPARAAAAPTGLSPSRAGDFLTCPLLYRLRVIDRLPEPPSSAATRGTLVHAVLERLFDSPAADRTPERALGLLRPQWERLLGERPELAGLFPEDPDGAALTRWLGDAEKLVAQWFRLEDPTRLHPVERELYVETALESGLLLRGYIDRVDVAPTGEVRLVDYKTGRAPSRDFEGKAMFQMKFYALVVWRWKGVLPGGCSWSTWAAAGTWSATTRTRRTCWPWSASCWRCGSGSVWRWRPATSRRPATGSATGATTGPAVRSSAARPRRTRCPWRVRPTRTIPPGIRRARSPR